MFQVRYQFHSCLKGCIFLQVYTETHSCEPWQGKALLAHVIRSQHNGECSRNPIRHGIEQGQCVEYLPRHLTLWIMMMLVSHRYGKLSDRIYIREGLVWLQPNILRKLQCRSISGWSHYVHSQEAERHKSWCSAHAFFAVEFMKWWCSQQSQFFILS